MRLRVETGKTLNVRCCLYDRLSHPVFVVSRISLFYRAEGVVRRTPRFPLTIAIAYVSPDKIYG